MRKIQVRTKDSLVREQGGAFDDWFKMYKVLSMNEQERDDIRTGVTHNIERKNETVFEM